MAEIQVRASRIDKALLGEPGPLYLAVMRTGFTEAGLPARVLEKPTFRAVCERGVWGHDEIHCYARLYTKGIFPWR